MDRTLEADQYNHLRRAFEQARAGVDSPDTQQANIRTGEAVAWARSLDEALSKVADYEEARTEDVAGRLLIGLKLPRNAVTHGIPITARHSAGAPFPMTFPVVFKELEWISTETLLEALAQKQNPQARKIYSDELAGSPVARTLDAVSRWFAKYDPSVPQQS